MISIIVVTLVTSVFYVTSDTIETEFRQLVRKQLEQTEHYVSRLMESRYDQLVGSGLILSDDVLIRTILTDRSLNQDTRNDLVRSEILPKFTHLDIVLVTDSEGELLAHSTNLERSHVLLSTDWFPVVLEGEEAAGYIVADGVYFQNVAIPVFIAEEMVGVVLAGRALNQSDIDSIKKASQADMAIFKGNTVLQTTEWDVVNMSHGFGNYLSAFQTWLGQQDKALSMSMQTYEVDLLQERFLILTSYDPTEFAPPYAVVQSLDKRLLFLNNIQDTIIIIGGIGIGLVMIAGFLLSIGISRPIRQLQQATHEVEQEHFDYRVSIQTRDEFYLLGNSFNNMISALGEKQRIRQAFDKSVSKEIADQMLQKGLERGGEKRQATILFSDIREFTALAETIDENRLVAMLNRYFNTVSECIHGQKGIIDKYIGDAVMALFGVPVDLENHALYAVIAALDMLESVERFNAELKRTMGLTLSIGIGINTGQVIAGLVGSEDRLNYTVLGDEVNLASRIEGLTKTYATPIIISEPGYNAIKQSNAVEQQHLLFRLLDYVKVKGKETPVGVYDVMKGDASKTSHKSRSIKAYGEARGYMLEGKFNEALSYSKALQQVWPEDGPTSQLVQQCQYYIDNPERFVQDYEKGVRVFVSK